MVKKYFLSFFLIVTLAAGSTTVQAQTVIGMGTEQPNPNAVLELVPEQGNQGFLAPRLTTAQRQASSFTGKLSRADHGLLVFDINEGKFYYWFDGAWREGTSGRTGSPTSEILGTTWYTGTTAPSGVDAAEGDFYINESTGEVFKFDGNAFVSMGSIKGGPAANSPNLSSVLQQGSSAGNRKITDLDSPTDDNDAATKEYVDNHTDADDQSLENVLNEGNTANNNYQIKGLIDPTEPQDAATKAYVDNKVITAQPPPGLGTVLGVSSDANGRITNLSTPTSPNDAATKAYVDSRDLEDILNAGNDAGDSQIANVASPTADNHATNREYVDDQDNAVSVNSKITDFSFNSGTNILNLTEGSAPPYTVDLNPLKNGTPAALPEGNIFVGDNSSTPQAVTITGDISISPTGEVTINNAKITTDKIANAAVTKEKINADVAGNGLSKNSSTDPLAVKLGNGLAFDNSGAIRIFNPEAGYLGIGQGTDPDQNIQFRPMLRDGALNAAGELTVTGLRGRTVANTAPSDKQVLTWNGTAWAPASLPPGGGGLPALPNGRLFIGNNGNQPTPTTISGDITIVANGTATIAADAVDQTKINPDVAGAGLSQAGDGSLRVNLVGDVTTGGGGSNLTVTKLQGSQVATTPPSANGQVLTWNGSQWAPASLPPGSGGAQVSTGSGNPNGGTGNKGDIYVKDDGTIFIKTKANSNPNSWSPIPKTLSGNGEPGNGQGNRGDTYVRTDGDGEVYIKGASGWVEVD